MIKYILYNKITNEVLNRTSLVSETEYPSNLNPDYEIFVPYEPFEKPDWDSRYYDYSISETPLDVAHPTYSIYKQWLVEHILTKKTDGEIFVSIENARKLANFELVDPDMMIIAYAISIKQLNGIKITDDENEILQEYLIISNKVLTNKNLELSKKEMVLNGFEPDIDLGWEQ